jgi:hypothetical protein
MDASSQVSYSPGVHGPKTPFRASHLIPFIRQAWPWRLPVGVANREGRTVSSLTDASSSSLLSPEALSVVQASAPVVAAHAD